MASQIGLLFQDQNSGVQYKRASVVGKTNAVKSQKKGGGLGGRKPLGEISNSANIAPAQASKKQNSKGFAFVKEVTYEDSNKKSNISKTSGKVQTRSRKALSDISNSGIAHLHEASKSKQSLKLSVVEEEHLFPSCIAEEQFLHDHRKCIKAQAKQMDVEEFLVTAGLTNVLVKQVKSPLPLESSKVKDENYLYDLELEEISEYLIDEEGLREQKLNSPLCRTPKLPIYSSTLWEDCGSIDFKLMETP